MRWPPLSLLRLDKEGALANCRLILMTTSSPPASRGMQSRGLVRDGEQLKAGGAGFPLDPGDPTYEKTLDSQTRLVRRSVLTGCHVFYRTLKVELNFIFGRT